MPDTDHIELYNERAAIREYDGGMTRAAAEVAAYWDWRRQVGPKVPVPVEIQECFMRAKKLVDAGG